VPAGIGWVNGPFWLGIHPQMVNPRLTPKFVAAILKSVRRNFSWQPAGNFFWRCMVSVPYRFTGWKEAPEWGFHIGIGEK
jgi:hypothetical protein